MEVYIGIPYDKEDGTNFVSELVCDTTDCPQEFFSFDQTLGIVTISQQAQAGNYTFTLTLQDGNQDPQEARYSFEIEIKDIDVAVHVEETDEPNI